jgi:hypothetical protein
MTDWSDVERDILLFYHRTSLAPGDPAPVDFEGLYPRPYWELLDPQGLPAARRDFIREGCLVLMSQLALAAWDEEPAGPRRAALGPMRAALDALDERRDRFVRLINIVRAFIALAESRGAMTEDLQTLADEVREDHVGRWFRERAALPPARQS